LGRKKEKKANKEKKEKRDSFLIIIFSAVSIFLAIRFFTSFFTQQRFWGLNQAGYIDGLVILYLILAAVGLWLYYRGRHSGALWNGGVRPPQDTLKSIYPYLIFVLAGVGFYLFSTAAHFLGDGYQLISQLSDPTLILKSESFGDMKTHQLLAQLLAEQEARMGIYLSFKYIAIISGLVFVLSLLYYGRKIAETVFGYLSFVIISILSASTILFFGYVETYGPVTAFLYLFFISALSSVKNGQKSIVPLIALVLAIFFHKIAIIFLPVFLIYILMVFSGEKLTNRLTAKSKSLLSALAAIILVFYIAVIIAAPLDIKRIFLSPFGDRFTTDGYALLSLKHIADYINLVLFLSPLMILAFAVGRKWPLKSDKPGIEASKFFILTAVIIGGLAAFLIEPKLGMARDWDLFSTMLIPAQLAGVYLWTAHFESHRRFQPATIMIALLSLSVFIPWLALNNSREGLYHYAIQVMQQDPKHGRNGIYTMIPFHQKQGNQAEEQRLRRYCSVNYPETEMVRQTERYLLEGDLGRANRLVDRAIAENPSFFRGYQLKGRIQMNAGKYDEALDNLEIADALNPYNSNNSYYRGSILSKKGQKEKAIMLYRQSIQYDALNPFPYLEIADYYSQLGRRDSAKYYYRQMPDTVDVYPHELLYRFGINGLNFGDTSRALLFFDRYLEIGDDSTLIDEVTSLKNVLNH